MILFPVLVLLAGGIVCLWVGDEKAKLPADLFTFAAAVTAILAAVFAPDGSITLLHFAGNLSISFSADPLARFFVVLISLVFRLVQFYAPGYMSHEGKQARFYAFFQFTFAVLLGVSLSANAITFYMCFELMTLLSMPLVLHDGSEKSRIAAFKYLGYSTLGASLALLGFFIASAHLETLSFLPGGVPIQPGFEKQMLAAYFLIFIGFGCKAGLAPLQMWLTEAHPVAPSPASAVLSGIITKTGVLAILRTTFYLFGAETIRGTWVHSTLTVMALLTVFLGSMLAFREKVLKKRMAYSTISNVSYVLFGIISLNMVSFQGAMLQVVFHALAKDVLFLAAGAIILKTGFTRVDQLRGIGRRMPVTMWCFTLAALSLVGIPPLGGFIAKWYLCVGAISANSLVGILGTVVLMISALLTAFYLLSITAAAFFPGADTPCGERCEISCRMLIPLVVFSAIIIVLGAFPNCLVELFSSIGAVIF